MSPSVSFYQSSLCEVLSGPRSGSATRLVKACRAYVGVADRTPSLQDLSFDAYMFRRELVEEHDSGPMWPVHVNPRRRFAPQSPSTNQPCLWWAEQPTQIANDAADLAVPRREIDSRLIERCEAGFGEFDSLPREASAGSADRVSFSRTYAETNPCA